MARRTMTSILVAVLLCGCGAQRTSEKQKSGAAKETAPKEQTAQDTKPKRTKQSGGDAKSASGQSGVEEDYVDFPAVGVKLIKPKDFEKAEAFHGFARPRKQCSVMITKIPGPFSKITAGFTSENMESKKMVLLSKENTNIDGRDGVLLHVKQTRFLEYQKWILVIGNGNETIMINATFPEMLELAEPNLSRQLKSAVLSAKLLTGPPTDPREDVPFVITPSPKLELTPSLSKSLGYTKDGVLPAKSPEDPFFVATPSLFNVVIADKREYALRRLHQTADTTKITKVRSTVAISIDGLSGFESVADAEDKKSGVSLVVYQVMLFDEGSYILMGDSWAPISVTPICRNSRRCLAA